ncbi:helix-turn-helix domain-containing protein [Pseudonocardia sichuanensis]
MNEGTEPRTIGERIQTIRERTGKSRPVVAGLVGRSAEWLKAVEKGRRQPPRLDMLVRLAEVLGVRDLSELTGETSLDIGTSRRSGHPVVPAIREAIEGVELATSGASVPPGELQQRTARAWEVWHTSPTPRASAGAMLPQLIRDGRRAVRVLAGQERRQAYIALSGAYALAEQVLAWVADSALLWLAADRCMECAQQADDPDTLAAAAWVLGNVWRSTGREEDAWQLVQDASTLLEPYLADGTDQQRALWGANQLHASITAARLGREGDALRALDQGDEMSARLPAGYAHPWTLFGKANAVMTGISVHVDLRKSGHALDYANAGDLDAVPSLDRRTRLWLEIARGYAQRKDPMATLAVLQRAMSISEESMRCHPIARGLAGDLVATGGRLVERDARALAGQLGLTV